MKARRVRDRKLVLGNAAIQERIWAVSQAVPGSVHGYKYSLALIVWRVRLALRQRARQRRSSSFQGPGIGLYLCIPGEADG